MTVLLCADKPGKTLDRLLERYAMHLQWVADDHPIPGSHFGDPEAGLIGNTLLVRNDTPLHSAFHETCHYICMDDQRRQALHTDAGGDYDEENGVCYLQILLADQLPGFGRERMFRDMDAWGYSFRLGSSRAWFENDAEDARTWLMHYHLIDEHQQPTWKLRK
ncbi:hypothetical protein [Thiolapillus sp.]